MTQTDLIHAWSAIVAWVMQVVSAAIPSAAIAGGLLFALFKYSGQKWVEQLLSRDIEKFKRGQQQELEAFKGEQQKELERLRHLFSSRISQIHQKEFEVLPKAWLMLNDLHGAVMQAVDLTIKYYPDFNSFSDAQLEAFLNSPPVSSWLSEHKKSELRNADDQGRYYMNALKVHYIDEANEKHRLFLNHLIEHRIFMTESLRTKFYAAQKSLFSVLTSYSIGRDGKKLGSRPKRMGRHA